MASALAQDQSAPPAQPGTPPQTPTAAPQAPGQPSSATTVTHKQIADSQLKQEEHQRILGIFPNFNTTSLSNAASLSAKQKFELAFATVSDPITFAVAGADAGYSQWTDDYKGYGQGAEGYFKRFGASYADSFDGTMIGNAILPALLHQDPRYFRKGTGSVMSRIGYAIATTVICKGDNGKWQPNISNVAGNFIAGGISNLYYPATDRGAGLTATRALTVTAEGSLGALFDEFWPDVSRHFRKKKE